MSASWVKGYHDRHDFKGYDPDGYDLVQYDAGWDEGGKWMV